MGNKNFENLIIIIPCYNEYNRLPIKDFQDFLGKEKETILLFVNDASTDDTTHLLTSLQKEYPTTVLKISNPENLGKAESIRKAVLYCLENQLGEYYAYLDADLATPLEECQNYLNHLKSGKKFVFASRILKIGSIVERKFSRFVFGRIIATIISNILDIKVYDTQCGCKLFTKEIGEVVFERPFISKWLFDVEIFSRILKHYGKEEGLRQMDEIPVKKWVDKGDSKVKLSYFFRLWIDLYRIRSAHQKTIV